MPLPLPVHGRGASSNPPNRFETLAVERDEWVEEDDPLPRTVLYRDATRDVLSRNDSPDVPMEYGINPYRGCEHGCVYCLSPSTPVLHSDRVWRPLGDVQEGAELVGFDEYPAPGATRKLRKGTVEAVWWSRKPTLRLITERTEVIVTADHLWLPAGDLRWSRTDHLAVGSALRHLEVDAPEPEDDDYRAGHMAGRTIGVEAERGTRGFRRGFVAGFFEAEGRDGAPALGPQPDRSVLERVAGYARSLGVRTRLEIRRDGTSTLRRLGSVADPIRFLSILPPAGRREAHRIFGRTPPTRPDRIVAIEAGPVTDVVDIQTSTGTFYAAGLATHNCFARPTHEYLGFSAGLDFETRILVKEDAPALLRKRLSSPRWKPRPVMMSGVTDPYQPIERRLRVTRGVLEVLAEFRNPVAVITKNHLVTRDVDLLAELARHRAVAVVLSITTLRNELQRVMEPRTSVPARRLAAVRALADAGVPVGVNVAPVIPGLTDAELPAILEAAAEAGASAASYILLRLPHGVAPLFETWLGQHFPDRRDKVLNRLRDLHGGRLYDSSWGHRKRGAGAYAEQIEQVFRVARRKAGLDRPREELSSAAFRRPDEGGQLGLF